MDIKTDINLKGTIAIQDSGLSTTDTATGLIVQFTYGESISIGAAVYLKSDGSVYNANATGISTAPVIGIALVAAASGLNNVLLMGVICHTAWSWTVAGPVYLDTSAGGLTQTQPTGTDNIIQIIGVATASDRIFVVPGRDYITHI